MHFNTLRSLTSLAVTSILLGAANPVLATPSYTVQVIGPSDSIPTGINNSGEAVIYGMNFYQWPPTSGASGIPASSPGYFSSIAWDINNQSNLAGELMPAFSGDSSAFFYDASTGQTHTFNAYAAYGINDNNEVVGRSYNGDDGYIWSPQTGMVSIGSISGFDHMVGASINNHSTVVGNANNFDAARFEVFSQAFMWSAESGIQTLDQGALENFGINSFANDINDNNIIVGQIGRRAALWDEELNLHFLDRLDNPYQWLGSQANAINENGDIVGSTGGTLDEFDNEEYVEAIIWLNGIPMELDQLIDESDPLYGLLELDEAYDINDRGQILAISRIPGTALETAYLLTPTAVPLPGAVWLFLSSLIVLSANRFKHYSFKYSTNNKNNCAI